MYYSPVHAQPGGAKLYLIVYHILSWTWSMGGVHLRPMRLWNFLMWPIVTYAMPGVVPIIMTCITWQLTWSKWTLYPACRPKPVLVLLQRFLGLGHSNVCHFAMNKWIPRRHTQIARACQKFTDIRHNTTQVTLLCYRKLHRSASDVILRLIPNNFSNNNKSHNLGLHGSNSWAPIGL